MDCIFKAVPPSLPRFKLMVISAYNNIKKKAVLCPFILLYKENEETFNSIFNYLKNNFSFLPPNLICVFSIGQEVNSIKKFFQILNCTAISFTFHNLYGEI